MEKRTRARCASHFRARAPETNERARSQPADGPLLRERLSFGNRGKHFEAGRLQRTLERSGQLGGVESRQAAHRRRRRRMNGEAAATVPSPGAARPPLPQGEGGVRAPPRSPPGALRVPLPVGGGGGGGGFRGVRSATRCEPILGGSSRCSFS